MVEPALAVSGYINIQTNESHCLTVIVTITIDKVLPL